MLQSLPGICQTLIERILWYGFPSSPADNKGIVNHTSSAVAGPNIFFANTKTNFKDLIT